jgi:hypothetical protein
LQKKCGHAIKFENIFNRIGKDHSGSLSKNQFRKLITLAVKGNSEIVDHLSSYFDALWLDVCQTSHVDDPSLRVEKKQVNLETATNWLFQINK